MKIKSIKVNGFGNLENKEIVLKEGINIIKGDNESGKSTLLKLIQSVFYGASKNKNGKEISDYDKYKPWKEEIEFSGKIIYCLDDATQYEVFRDFHKRNPKIYNKNMQDISSQYNIDKTKGNRFFVEQTGIDEELFLSSVVTMQKEIKIEEKEKNTILQKISNLISSGEDNVSFKKSMNYLSKRLTDEIGTDKTSKKPINIINERIKQIQIQKEQLRQYENRQYEIEEQTSQIKEKRIDQEKRLHIFLILKEMRKEQGLLKEKIKVNQELNEENKKEINELKLQRERFNHKETIDKKSQKGKAQKNTKLLFGFCIGLFIIGITSFIFLKNIWIGISILLIASVCSVFSIRKKNVEKTNIDEKIQNQHLRLDSQIEIIEKAIQKGQEDIKEINNIIEDSIKKKQEEIPEINIQKILEEQDIEKEYDRIQKSLNELIIEEKSLLLEKQNVIPKLEYLSSLEEELEYLEEQYTQLKDASKSILLAKEVLEQSYKEMKQNITPKFTQSLSYNINKISGGKYKNMNLTSENELMVEQSNGEYIKAELLSEGTIDQIYLSLRLAILEEITKEKMPIILDESFAYYDEKRLEGILEYLSNLENQIIILTCTNREIELLQKNDGNINLIRL